MTDSDLIFLDGTDPEVRRSRFGGALRSAAQTCLGRARSHDGLFRQVEVCADTSRALTIAAYYLHIWATVALHGMPDALEDFEVA